MQWAFLQVAVERVNETKCAVLAAVLEEDSRTRGLPEADRTRVGIEALPVISYLLCRTEGAHRPIRLIIRDGVAVNRFENNESCF